MKIKIICQICGRTEILNTEEKIGYEPRWTQYELDRFGIETPYDNYEIWICGKCHGDFVIGYYTDYDEGGSEHIGVEYDWESLEGLLLGSLAVHQGV